MVKKKKGLIIYSTVDGQTKKISEKISKIFEKKASVKIVELDRVSEIDLSKFDIIIIGASIRYGKHREKLYSFIKNNRIILDSKVTGFFSVNVVARKEGKNEPINNPYMIKFLKISNWIPNHLAVFAGRIDYPSLGTLDRIMIKFIMWLTNGPTNTKLCYEFTDWKKVKLFAEKASS